MTSRKSIPVTGRKSQPEAGGLEVGGCAGSALEVPGPGERELDREAPLSTRCGCWASRRFPVCECPRGPRAPEAGVCPGGAASGLGRHVEKPCSDVSGSSVCPCAARALDSFFIGLLPSMRQLLNSI